MWLLIIVWWIGGPTVLLGGLIVHHWLEGRRERSFEANAERLRGMHERHAVSVLRPNGSVENVIPLQSRRRDEGAA